jgi:hypothetical protein
VPGSRLVSPRVDYQRFGVRLSRHRWGFISWDANNSGPVRTTGYDLFTDRVGGSLGWSDFLPGSESVWESVNASDFSRRQCRITSCASSPALSDDDQCLRRHAIGGPCSCGNLALSNAAWCSFKIAPATVPEILTCDRLGTVETAPLEDAPRGPVSR